MLAADNWMQAVASATATTGSHSELHAVLEAHIVREWEGTLADVAGWLRIKSGGDFLRKELALATHPGCLAQRIIVLGALETAGLIADSSTLQTEFLFGNPTPHDDPDSGDGSLVHAFCQRLLDAGHPPCVIDALKSGRPTKQIDTMVRKYPNSTRELLANMSDDLLARLLACREWPDDSWIRSAMRRRVVGKRQRPPSKTRHRMFDHLV